MTFMIPPVRSHTVTALSYFVRDMEATRPAVINLSRRSESLLCFDFVCAVEDLHRKHLLRQCQF
ncbi:hypothetical protein NEOLEDRAFT_1129253 [Neolentinus lepideus HHB14362 ss-1]|uniref:Uncharacterized protein n=1 Tax=Neolentinus lepideus HHB14362 ss-1 TaxID=1314782 RepID=A0A165UP05_9AGAM|nr:hypothetical protein NEOLEDRAFT_1129253 [Neolentinus lepideus HHB14362 ss-1]